MIYRSGLHFDNMVHIIENSMEGTALGTMRSILNKTKLFIMEEPADISIPNEYSLEEQEWYRKNLHLPFPITAIEDPNSVVILKRSDDEFEDIALPFENLNLLFCAWVTSFGLVNKKYNKHLLKKDEQEHLKELSHPKTGIFVSGILDTIYHTPNSLGFSGEIFSISYFNKGVFTKKELKGEFGLSPENVLNEAKMAVEQVMMINSPNKFVLETQPINQKKEKKGTKHSKRPKLSSERSIFSILYPNRIRQQMKLPKPNKNDKKMKGHDVRSHKRILAHERYIKMRGEEILIRAHWRGPKENTVGNKRYVVRLDL